MAIAEVHRKVISPTHGAPRVLTLRHLLWLAGARSPPPRLPSSKGELLAAALSVACGCARADARHEISGPVACSPLARIALVTPCSSNIMRHDHWLAGMNAVRSRG